MGKKTEDPNSRFVYYVILQCLTLLLIPFSAGVVGWSDGAGKTSGAEASH